MLIGSPGPSPCPACQGEGEWQQRAAWGGDDASPIRCEECQGTGQVECPPILPCDKCGIRDAVVGDPYWRCVVCREERWVRFDEGWTRPIYR